jgi:hypothetical protein
MAQGVKYATEEERKEAKKAANRRWRERNDRSDYYKEYYDRLSPEKRDIIRERNRQYAKDRPEQYREYRRKNYENNKENWTRTSTEMNLLKNSRTRARKKGLPHDILLEDIVIPEFCPVFPEIRLSKENSKSENDSPSLDRIRPELGYVKGNIVVMSHLANTIKSFGTAEQHRRIAEWMDSLD